MQTSFTPEQLASPDNASSEKIIRTCVHCGFCTATCPTFLLLGDELDSPRGRIYLMKEMLEKGGPPSPQTVKHVDRCLSCLSCMTTCPSGVNYMHLVDHARSYIEEHHVRPWPERFLRSMLAFVLPDRTVFRWALRLANLGRPFAGLLPGRLKGMAAMAPRRLPAPDPAEKPQVFAAQGTRRARVALMAGCAQPVLAPEINGAAIRLLNRLGVEIVTSQGSGCCGALTHHLGKTDRSHAQAKANITAWSAEMARGELDAIMITASGCGTTVKDYGFMFRDDPVWAGPAAAVSAIAKDVSEVLTGLDSGPSAVASLGLRVAYHSACSLQHGQGVRDQPKALLKAAGFTVVEPLEPHICCGSAGTYNLLQPEIAGQLRERKVANLEATRPDVIATGNIGCMTQIGGGSDVPIVHTVELLDWAAGGPIPAALASTRFATGG
ncbi:MAG: glycolate oxidase subunit GlcF [Pseudomonadota bacterium]|uniref:glycolate oxidase subunit GlcF n=1 Tax=unclassified Phenylobacterium TaxID=2640670 RepID=UPI0007014EA9|nr:MULTISPECIES: glycolate oxidase subunit GlcF [unclassified Phenylobacterium]KRB41672.1 2-hydroxy-acid oxidase [Phenylobacterium sp. Root700]MBT9472291.1 glycolate oxidase subunit GlcF [Phenylobacterium sp.]